MPVCPTRRDEAQPVLKNFLCCVVCLHCIRHNRRHRPCLALQDPSLATHGVLTGSGQRSQECDCYIQVEV